MTTDSDSECSYVANLADFNIIRVIIIVIVIKIIVIKIVYNSQKSNNSNSYSNNGKKHSLQAVELSQRTQAAVQIVSNLPAPSNDGPIYRFLGMPAMRTPGWLALLLIKVGDVETNPGPTTLNKRVWICDICHKQIHVRKQISIRCNRIEHWVHLRCAGIRKAQYTDTWTCHLHR